MRQCHRFSAFDARGSGTVARQVDLCHGRTGRQGALFAILGEMDFWPAEGGPDFLRPHPPAAISPPATGKGPRAAGFDHSWHRSLATDEKKAGQPCRTPHRCVPGRKPIYQATLPELERAARGTGAHFAQFHRARGFWPWSERGVLSAPLWPAGAQGPPHAGPFERVRTVQGH